MIRDSPRPLSGRPSPARGKARGALAGVGACVVVALSAALGACAAEPGACPAALGASDAAPVPEVGKGAPAQPPATQRQACPSGLASDRDRARRIAGLLATAAEAATVLAGTDTATFCFGVGVEPALVGERVVRLPADTTVGDAAARAAHLLHHARPGSVLAGQPTEPCATWVAAALDEEARAHRLERALRVRFGLAAGATFERDEYAARYAARCRASTME